MWIILTLVLHALSMPLQQRISTTPLEAGNPASIQVTYHKSEQAPAHTMFMNMHAKPMHMVIIKKDLSSFAHLHPSFSMRTGKFTIDLNTSSEDPDNQQQQNAIPWGGQYWVFTEVMPMMMHQMLPMQMDRFELNVSGQRSIIATREYPDAKQGISKWFEGNLKATLSYEALEFCDFWLPKFYLQLETLDGLQLRPVTELERWLEMGGHGMLIEAGSNNPLFSHLHALLPVDGDGEFVFPYEETRPPPRPGNYKIWFQFKWKGVIRTISFDFSYRIPEQDTKTREKAC